MPICSFCPSGGWIIFKCLSCLKYHGKHQHNQIQRPCRGDRPKGLLPYPDNSVSLKAKVTVYPLGCLLEPRCDSAHIPRERQVVQIRRPARGPEVEAQEARRVMVGRLASRHPGSQGTHSQLHPAAWVWPKQCLRKARLHYPSLLLLGQDA